MSFLQLTGFSKKPSSYEAYFLKKGRGLKNFTMWWENMRATQKGALPVRKRKVDPRETSGELENILAQKEIS